MKVFISWSGPTSKKLGEAIRTWLPATIQSVTPYFTPEDIEKGTRWNSEIAKELESAQVGILCMTPDNLDSKWLLFEAGALSKSLDKARVCPVLFGMENSDLKGPLIQFQTASFNRDDFGALLGTINSALGEKKLSDETLSTVFDKWWPDIEEKVGAILSEAAEEGQEPVRTERDMLEELVETTRQMQSQSLKSSDISGKAINHLVDHFVATYKSVKSRDHDETTMARLSELVKSVQYIAQKLAPVLDDASDFDASLLASLIFECDPLVNPPPEDDIPF